MSEKIDNLCLSNYQIILAENKFVDMGNFYFKRKFTGVFIRNNLLCNQNSKGDDGPRVFGKVSLSKILRLDTEF